MPPTILEEVKPVEEAVVAEPELVKEKKDEELEEEPEGGKGGKEG